MLLAQTPAGSVLPGDDAPLNLKTTMPKELMRPTDSITWSVMLLVLFLCFYSQVFYLFPHSVPHHFIKLICSISQKCLALSRGFEKLL